MTVRERLKNRLQGILDTLVRCDENDHDKLKQCHTAVAFLLAQIIAELDRY